MKNFLTYFFLIIVIPFFLESCDRPNIKTQTTDFKYGENGSSVNTYTINGHEYIGSLYGGHSDWATHSGTCPNPIHKCQTDTVYISKPADTVFCIITPAGTKILESLK